jgi:CRISPR/Cas system-associated exonuclease Cas4 (RecB family)
MKSFLLDVAQHIKAHHTEDLSNLCVVVPGKRSIVFLKKHLAAVYGKPFFAPAFFSIENFIERLTGIEIATQTELLLLLYQIHRSRMAEQKDNDNGQSLSLHEFAGNAQLMLSDFNEIDASLTDTEILFSSLYAIKKLSFFGKRDEELSVFQRNYLFFFKELHLYYQRLSQSLAAQKKGYQGLIYRKAAENIAHYIGTLPYTKYVFAGFNALTPAETRIVHYLHQTDRLDYIIDADILYTEDKIQEAGKFIRSIQKSVFGTKPLSVVGNYFAETPKQIHIMGLPQAVTQAKIVQELLDTIQLRTGSLDSTAIVPADESLLLPILHSIDTTHVNITMGYPVKRTVLYQLLSNLFSTLENKSLFHAKNKDNTVLKLYYKDLFIFFNNPYISALVDSPPQAAQRAIATQILKNAPLFYSEQAYNQLTKTIPAPLQTLLRDLFYHSDTIESSCRLIAALLRAIGKESKLLNPVEEETLYQLYNYIMELQKAIGTTPIDITSFRFLFENHISERSLSFHSDAIEGVQLLGLLETRTLDFKNLILLSVNEGILPVGKTSSSFIPYDVKQHFGLQTYKGKDAVFSYHFYRLLQRAEHVYLLYSLDSKNGSMEKSRFIYQLKNKLKGFTNIEITEEIKAYPPIAPEAASSIVIQKTEAIVTQLKKQPYSASSINTYLACGLRFYFQYVLQLKDEDAFAGEDILQSNVIGTIIHAVLEQAVENGRFKQMNKQEIEEAVRMNMCNGELNLTENDLLYEKNHLVFQIIIKYIDTYLNHAQASDDTIRIEKTEEKIAGELFVGDTPIGIKGTIDRVDSQQGIKRIVDYKTGSVKDADLKIKDVHTAFDGEHPKALQLLFYAYLFYKHYGETVSEAEIVSLRKIKTSYSLLINKEKQLHLDDFTAFEQGLIQTIQAILDPQLPFAATTHVQYCSYCNYNSLCRR